MPISSVLTIFDNTQSHKSHLPAPSTASPQQRFDNAAMGPFNLALFIFLAIFSMNSLADHHFKNCSSFEQFLIRSSVRHAQRLIAFAELDGSSEFIETTGHSDASADLNDMKDRWRAGNMINMITGNAHANFFFADIYTTIAMKLPQITFDCANDNSTIQIMCDAASDSMSKSAQNLSPLFVKTGTGSLTFCKDRALRDHRSSVLQIAHELIEVAEKIESDRRGRAILQNLVAIDYHAQQVIEDLCNLLLSLDEYYVTNFWKRAMDWYGETIGRIAAILT
ncbi:hypothetical protein HII31_10112 [Pseudocercospora fuligena]|uniref:Uncharacterized protein n=1 Tax=Pseudocercospora fuligena TaxID=685502 RepID=A0A8H6VIW9_9PEZI|nr:hypothetical protein HII31_10112 [Pseudocercospora fuligena]